MSGCQSKFVGGRKTKRKSRKAKKAKRKRTRKRRRRRRGGSLFPAKVIAPALLFAAMQRCGKKRKSVRKSRKKRK